MYSQARNKREFFRTCKTRLDPRWSEMLAIYVGQAKWRKKVFSFPSLVPAAIFMAPSIPNDLSPVIDVEKDENS